MLPLVCVSSPKKINSRSDIIQINFRRPIFVTSILSSSVFCKHFPSCKVGPSQSACFCVFSISSSHWIFTLLCSFFLSLSLFLSLHDYGSSPSSVMLLIPIGLSISRTLLHPCCRLWIMKNILFPTPLSLYTWTFSTIRPLQPPSKNLDCRDFVKWKHCIQFGDRRNRWWTYLGPRGRRLLSVGKQVLPGSRRRGRCQHHARYFDQKLLRRHPGYHPVDAVSQQGTCWLHQSVFYTDECLKIL